MVESGDQRTGQSSARMSARITTWKFYHRGINGRVNRAYLPFYVIVPLLRDEARDVTITARVVSESMVTRNQREVYKNTHGRILALGDAYEDDKSYSTSRLLREMILQSASD